MHECPAHPRVQRRCECNRCSRATVLVQERCGEPFTRRRERGFARRGRQSSQSSGSGRTIRWTSTPLRRQVDARDSKPGPGVLRRHVLDDGDGKSGGKTRCRARCGRRRRRAALARMLMGRAIGLRNHDRARGHVAVTGRGRRRTYGDGERGENQGQAADDGNDRKRDSALPSHQSANEGSPPHESPIADLRFNCE